MKPSIKILLVEDNPYDAELLREMLLGVSSVQFEWVHVPLLGEALKRLREEKFDAILLDLSLPDSLGQETLAKAYAQAHDVPIVVLTGHSDENLAIRTVHQGAQDYLVKGQVDVKRLSRVIRYAIERKQVETALKQAEASLQRERDQLEVRVQERTAELSEANRALRKEISRRERAEAAHREVLRRLVTAEEIERGRVSRELHDQLGQDLTALKLGLQIVRKRQSCPPPVRESVSRLEQLTDSLMRDTHRLAWDLRPAALDDFGLEMALRRFVEEWAALTGVPVDFHSRGETRRRLSRDIETTLYRITREALTNVLRHAKAHRVSVLLERHTKQISLIIEDDGQGFNATALLGATATAGKMGLLGMQERAAMAGGSVQIESSPGAGTTVFARLPLALAPTARAERKADGVRPRRG